jgi:hypothetical protein
VAQVNYTLTRGHPPNRDGLIVFRGNELGGELDGG